MLPNTSPSELRREAADRCLGHTLAVLDRHAQNLLKFPGAKSPLLVDGQHIDVPDLTQRDAYTFIEGIREEIKLITDGRDVLPRHLAEALFNITEQRGFFAVLYRLAFLSPAEWVGLIEEPVEQPVEPIAEDDARRAFALLLEAEEQRGQVFMVGMQRRAFDPDAQGGVVQVVRSVMGDIPSASSSALDQVVAKLMAQYPSLETLYTRPMLKAMVSFALEWPAPEPS